MVDISLQKLIESGAHYGHQSKRWNPKMEPYIYGVQDGVHVFDLVKTKQALEEALDKISEVSRLKGNILILGTKKQAKEKVFDIAHKAGIFFVTERWLGGTFTNFTQIKKSTKKLVDMKQKLTNGEYKDRTKKERLLIEREIARLERFFGGLVGMDVLPDVLIVIDTKREKSAIREARLQSVSTIGIVDTNADPTSVDYPIPMNDDATRALDYILELFEQAVMEGKEGKSKKSNSDGKGKMNTSIGKTSVKKIKPKSVS
jgi:small subunit ribosomal protein S2